MENRTQKTQLIMVIILGGILCIVLIFKAKITKAIKSLRNKSSNSGKVASLKIAKSSEPDSDEFKIIKNKIKQLKINPLCTDSNLWDNLPDHLERDIFDFKRAPRRPKYKKYSAAKKLKKTKKINKFKLEATFTGGRPLCVINNQTLNIGDKISDYMVQEIQDGLVILNDSGKTITLRLKQEMM